MLTNVYGYQQAMRSTYTQYPLVSNKLKNMNTMVF